MGNPENLAESPEVACDKESRGNVNFNFNAIKTNFVLNAKHRWRSEITRQQLQITPQTGAEVGRDYRNGLPATCLESPAHPCLSLTNYPRHSCLDSLALNELANYMRGAELLQTGHLIHGPAIIRHRNWNANGNGRKRKRKRGRERERGNVNENGDGDGNACNKFLVWNNLRINCLTFPTQTNNEKKITKKTEKHSPTSFVANKGNCSSWTENKFRFLCRVFGAQTHTYTRDHHMPARTTIDRCYNKFPPPFRDYETSQKTKKIRTHRARSKHTKKPIVDWLTTAANLSSSLF